MCIFYIPSEYVLQTIFFPTFCCNNLAGKTCTRFFFNIVIILSSIYSFAFSNTDQWMYLYLIGVIYSILLIFMDHQSRKNTLLNKISNKIINANQSTIISFRDSYWSKEKIDCISCIYCRFYP